MKDNLTLKQFVEEKRKVEIALNEVLADFKERTGCIVTDVKVTTFSGTQAYLQPEVTF